MNLPIRSFLALTILVVVLAACGTSTAAPPSEPAVPTEPAAPTAEPTVKPTAEPSVEPSEPAAEERDVAGTITIAEMAYSGPGGTIQEALDAGPSGDLPTLVNGVVFRDLDGAIYLASAVSDVDAPTFEGPMLEVIGIDADGPEFDMANAELLGLEEAGGIVFRQNAQILGYLELP